MVYEKRRNNPPAQGAQVLARIRQERVGAQLRRQTKRTLMADVVGDELTAPPPPSPVPDDSEIDWAQQLGSKAV